MEKNNISVFKKIEELSNTIGLPSDEEKTIIKIEKTQNPDVKTATLESGSWEAAEPWFVIDEDDKLHTLVSIDSILKIVESLKTAQQENFNLKLEKTIWKNIPIDFNDVWAVAMDEIRMIAGKKSVGRAINVDVDELVRNIKKDHPNLFLNIKDFYLPKEIQ